MVDLDAGAHYNYAIALHRLGQAAAAVQEFKRVVQLEPYNVDALFHCGCYELDVKRWENAYEIFTRCINLAPRPDFFLKRAMSLRLLKRYSPSLADFSQCIHLDPDNALAFFYRGCLLSSLDPRRAVRDLSVSLLIDSSARNINCFLHRSKLYLSQGRVRQALADLQNVLTLNKDPNESRSNVVYAVMANCQLGRIHMQHFRNLAAAIRWASSSP